MLRPDRAPTEHIADFIAQPDTSIREGKEETESKPSRISDVVRNFATGSK